MSFPLDFKSKSVSRSPVLSPISQMSSRLKHFDYPLVVRVMDRHLVITSPDFEFPIPIVVPYDPPSVETGGKALLAAWLQVADYLKELSLRKETAPSPKSVNNLFPRVLDEVSLQEACRILSMKPDMVRDLGDKGIIPMKKTLGGHRRFIRRELEDYRQKVLVKTTENETLNEGDN